MTYRMLGICFSAVVFAACSSDEQTHATGTDSGAGGSTGGSVSTGGKGGTGGANTGGSSTGGTATGGSGTGGKATGGAAGDGGPGTDASDASTGGADAGGTGGKGGTGGAGTGGAAADAGGPCAALTACCQNLSGRERAACTTISGAGNAANCEAVSSVFCQDGGPVGGGGDAGSGGCTALAACCSDSGARGTQCHHIVTRNDNTVCNQVMSFFCP